MNEENKEQPAHENSEAGIQPGTTSMLERADNLAKRIEEGNKQLAELLRKQEEVLSRQLLSGRAEAGNPQQQPKIETPKEYAERIMKNKK